MAEEGTVIDDHFAIKGNQPVVTSDDQRVDFGQAGVILDVSLIEVARNLYKRVEVFLGETNAVGQF
jgi:hypothetical protein